MMQRPAGQLHPDVDLLEQLEALLRAEPDRSTSSRPNALDEDEERLRRLEELTAGSVDPAPQNTYRSDDDPRDHEHIDRLRARPRFERRADQVRRAGRRSAVLALVGGLFVTMLMPAIATVGTSDTASPAVVSSPAPPAPSATPASTPTLTSAPGTLVRGTMEGGQPFAVVIPAAGPSYGLTLLAGVLIGIVSSFTTSNSAPLAEWIRRRLGLPGSRSWKDEGPDHVVEPLDLRLQGTLTSRGWSACRSQ